MRGVCEHPAVLVGLPKIGVAVACTTAVGTMNRDRYYATFHLSRREARERCSPGGRVDPPQRFFAAAQNDILRERCSPGGGSFLHGDSLLPLRMTSAGISKERPRWRSASCQT